MAAGLAGSVVLVGVLLVGVFPTRDWWSQREELRERREELTRLEAEGRELDARADELQTPEEVERIAREEYGMARPGEESFQMLPPAVPPVDLPDAWPFQGAGDWLNR